MEIKISSELLDLAKSTKPDGISLEDWILEWTKFGLEVAQKASSRKEAIEISANIEEAANRKFDELVQKVKDQMGTEKGQLFEEVGNQISDYEKRLKTLEELSDLDQKQVGFGKLFAEMIAFVDPKNTDSAIYKYNQMLENVDEEEGLVRQAVRAELAKDGGVSEKLSKISTKLEIDDAESEMRRKSTLKGDEFEDTLLNVLRELCGSNEVTFHKTKGQVGFASQGAGNRQKGDIRIDFGIDHVLYGNPIIIEVKSDNSFSQNNPGNPKISASHYLEKAMKNRQCKIGIWVQDSRAANEGKWPTDFTVSGDKIFVVWDEEDPSTDWLLISAIYIAMGRNRLQEKAEDNGEAEILEEIIEDLKLEVENFVEIQRMGTTIINRSKDLKGLIGKGSTRLADCLENAEKALRMMQSDSDDLTDLGSFEDSDSKAGAEDENQDDGQGNE